MYVWMDVLCSLQIKSQMFSFLADNINRFQRQIAEEA